MNRPVAVPDQIDQAIGAAAAPVTMVNLTLGLSTGRAVQLAVPVDLSGQEALELIGAVARDLPSAIVQAVQQARGPQLVVPGRGLVVPRA